MQIKKSIAKIFIGVISLVACSLARAQLVVPEFSGFWYTNILGMSDMDSCCKIFYKYDIQLQGTPQDVANIVNVTEDISGHLGLTDYEELNGDDKDAISVYKNEYSVYSKEQLKTTIINTLDNYNDKNADNLLPLATAYIYNENVPRAERLAFTWSLIKRYESNSGVNKRYVIIDILRDLYPIELTDELIQDFYSERSKANRRQLLWLLCEIAAGVAEEKNNFNFSVLKTTYVPQIRNFFYKEMMEEKDIPTLLSVIQLYSTRGLFSQEQTMEDMHKAFARTDINGEKIKEIVYGDTIKMWQRFISFHDLDMRQRYLKMYITNMNSDQAKRDKLSDGIPPMLAPLNRESADKNKHTDRILQQTFLNILSANKPIKDVQNIIKTINSPTPISVLSLFTQHRNIYDWLYSYNTLQSQTYDEANKKVAQAILNTNDFYLKYFLLCRASNEVINNISTKNLLGMYKDLSQTIFEHSTLQKTALPEEVKAQENLRFFNQFVYLRIRNILEARKVALPYR